MPGDWNQGTAGSRSPCPIKFHYPLPPSWPEACWAAARVAVEGMDSVPREGIDFCEWHPPGASQGEGVANGNLVSSCSLGPNAADKYSQAGRQGMTAPQAITMLQAPIVLLAIEPDRLALPPRFGMDPAAGGGRGCIACRSVGSNCLARGGMACVWFHRRSTGREGRWCGVQDFRAGAAGLLEFCEG